MKSTLERSIPALPATLGVLFSLLFFGSSLPVDAQESQKAERLTFDGAQPESDSSEPAGTLPSIQLYGPSGRATYHFFSFSGEFRSLFTGVDRPAGKLLTASPEHRWSLTKQSVRTTESSGLVGACIGSTDPKEPFGSDAVYPDLPAASTSSSNAVPLRVVTGAGLAAVNGWSDSVPVLAVLDTGIDFDHPDLSGAVLYPGLCFTSKYAGLGADCLCKANGSGGVPPSILSGIVEGCWPAPAPPDLPVGGAKCDSAMNWCDHGTHTAGHAARLDAGLRILPVQVNSKFDNPGFCHDPGPCVLSFESDRIRALHWLYEEALRTGGTKVSAVYLGQSAGAYRSVDECREAHPCMQIAVDNLWSVGIPVIAPAGNDYHREALGAPACLENVISVGASQEPDAMAFFTNAATNGDAPAGTPGEPDHRFFDFVAPGVEIETSMPCTEGICDARISGTSMAAAHVAAAWVRLKEVCGADRPEVVLQALRSLSRQRLTDSRGEPPAATDIPLVDVRTIAWDNAPTLCEKVLKD